MSLGPLIATAALSPQAHSAGGTEPGVPVESGTPRPVLKAAIIPGIGLAATAILEVLDATGADVPDWVTVVLLCATAVAGVYSQLVAQSKVTPVEQPRTNDGTPLVPAAADIDDDA